MEDKDYLIKSVVCFMPVLIPVLFALNQFLQIRKLDEIMVFMPNGEMEKCHPTKVAEALERNKVLAGHERLKGKRLKKRFKFKKIR